MDNLSGKVAIITGAGRIMSVSATEAFVRLRIVFVPFRSDEAVVLLPLFLTYRRCVPCDAELELASRSWSCWS